MGPGCVKSRKPTVISVLVTRNFCKMFLRPRWAFEFSHGLGQDRTRAAQQKCQSLDNLVGAGEESCWHGQTERLGGLEIDT
jgi:hypothetical protein